MKVWDVDRQLQEQKEGNRKLEPGYVGLTLKFDLKQGYDAIEERARFEIGNDPPDEVSFRFLTAPCRKRITGAAGAAN